MAKRIWIAVMLIVVLLSACAGKADQQPAAQPAAEPVVGTWTTQIDMTDTVNQMLLAQTGANTVSTGFSVVIELELRQDGTFELDIDRQQLDAQLDLLGNVLWQMVVEQATAQSGITSQEAVAALQAQGKSKEVLMQQLDLISMFENSLVRSGIWKQENGKIYMAPTEEELAESEGADLHFSGTQLTLTYTERPAEEGQEPVQTVVTYTRVEQ